MGTNPAGSIILFSSNNPPTSSSKTVSLQDSSSQLCAISTSNSTLKTKFILSPKCSLHCESHPSVKSINTNPLEQARHPNSINPSFIFMSLKVDLAIIRKHFLSPLPQMRCPAYMFLCYLYFPYLNTLPHCVVTAHSHVCIPH